MKKVATTKPAKALPELHMDEEDGEPKEWEVKEAVNHLERAEEIKANKKLMPHVHKAIGKKISSLAQLKEMGLKKKKEESDAESV